MEKAEIINERYPHVVRILRKGVGEGIEDDPFAEDVQLEDEILYEGKGRGFTDTTPRETITWTRTRGRCRFLSDMTNGAPVSSLLTATR